MLRYIHLQVWKQRNDDVIKDIHFENYQLSQHDDDTINPLPFRNEIKHLTFRRSFFMEEIVFYHTKNPKYFIVIVADLIQRFPKRAGKY